MAGELYKRYMEQEETKEEKIEYNKEIEMLDIDLLDNFNNHIFSAIPKNKFEELKESISRVGVLSPIIVRRKKDRYEIISGHNRVQCCRELDIKEVPAIIKDYDDDMSEYVMIDTNLAQRENILPCEKGLAYKKRLELLKKITKENKEKHNHINGYIDSDKMWQEKTSIQKLADDSDDGKTSVQKYIRLTKLIDELQNKVNNGTIGKGVGYELSFIKPEEQKIVNSFIDEMKKKITENQAKRVKASFGIITEENIEEIVFGKPNKKEVKFTGKLTSNILKKYKNKFANDKEFSELIDFLLENYYKNLSDERRTNLRCVILVESSAFKL
jgi:ParB family chromosome partitioning protein